MKRKFLPLLAALMTALFLTGCKFSDVMLYLYGGDEFVEADTENIQTYSGSNGMNLTYDANQWNAPVMAQDDTISVTSGNKLDYTAVLIQVTDTYTDFLAQSGEELSAETNTVAYDLELEVPHAETAAVRYDCGSYQAIFVQIDFDGGQTAYVSAASRAADYAPIITLLQGISPAE